MEDTLTERYRSLVPIVELLLTWGMEHMAEQIGSEGDGMRTM